MHKYRFCELLAISILSFQMGKIMASQIQNGCSADQFKCRNGYCIPATSMCDLKKDCMDESDESFEACHEMNCTAYKCSYGGCYSAEQYCDGHRDCWDGTDEYKFSCAENPNYLSQLVGDCRNEDYSEFQCQTSKECIRYTQLCDGTENCRDGSDEFNEFCVGNQCSKESFRCSYGACIARASACDHKIDCRDSSDELAPICNKWSRKLLEIPIWNISNALDTHRPEIKLLTTKTPDLLSREESCSVPSSNNVIYLTSMYNAMPYINGNPVPHGMSVRLSCGKGYGLIGDDVNTCDKGKWMASWAECIKTCERHKITNVLSIEAICIFDGQVKDCAKDPLYVNTEVESHCATGYKPDRWSENRSSGNQICDTTGSWQSKPISSPTFKCKPDCGKLFSTVQGHPWIVSIYKHTHNEVYEFMCLGTIVDPRYVLTAASCFTSSPSAHAILIVLGNHTIDFNKADENGFDTKTISHIYTRRNLTVILEMINPFKLSANIRPICLDNISQNLINNNTADNVLPGTPLEYYNSTSQTYSLTHIVDNNKHFIDLGGISKKLKNDLKRYEMKNRLL